MPPKRYQYSVITSSPELVVPSGRMIQGCGTVHLLGVVGLLPRWQLARIRPSKFGLIVVQVPERERRRRARPTETAPLRSAPKRDENESYHDDCKRLSRVDLG
jgi:hypothetical protein